jgi:uncharacterized membrane protein YkoI
MRASRLFILVVALLSAVSTTAGAQQLIDRRNQQPREPRGLVASGVSLDQAVQMAQSRYQAKAVKAETVMHGGRRTHQIRLLSAEGKVWMVRVDAETGSMR